MPYAFPTNIPRPAMHWTEPEQRKCVTAANAVLDAGKSESEAIYACIHAAGRTENPGGKTMSIIDRLAKLFNWTAKEAPTETGESGLFITKQADGAYRWVGWVSNHFRDNDNPREILSAKAHKDFVAYADTKSAYPELWLWHVPGSRVGTADMVDFADGFLVESGLFDPGKETVAEALSKETKPLTMSHGFLRTTPMTKDGVTDGYIQFEASITPKGVEANPFTDFQTIKEASMPLSPDKKAFLAKYLPEETIASLEGKTEELRKAAEAAGVDWKAVEGDDVTGVASTEPEATAPAPAAFNPAEFVDALAGPVAEAVIAKLELGSLSDSISEVKAKADKYDALAEQVTALAEALKELKKSDDEKLAEVLTPKAIQTFAWMGKAASKSPDNVVDPNDEKDKRLVSQKPFLAEIAERMAATVAAG